MELHQLRYFAAVVEAENFTRAAEQCFVSQPSLSQQIAKLEAELGQQLFDRRGRKVTVTEAGHVHAVRMAEAALAELVALERQQQRDAITGKGFRTLWSASPTPR